MAGQRRGEPRRDHRRRAPGARRLGGVWPIALILSLACRGEPLAPSIGLPFPGGGGASVTFDFSFAGFSPDRLVLDGSEYQRLG